MTYFIKPFAHLFLLIWLMFIFAVAGEASGPVWKYLNPGLEYTEFQPFPQHPGVIHAFRADLSYYRFTYAFPTQNQISGNVAQWTKQNKAILGINGGFFDPQFHALGLRIHQAKMKNPLKPISWWGIFYTKGKSPYIVSQHQFYFQKSTDFAIQSGPRLLVNNKIPHLKPGLANRTALGITQFGKVIILVTHNLPLSTYELAKMMQTPEKSGGFNCKDAINLDGGTSTQMYAHIHNFELHIPGLKNIADAVLLVSR